MSEVKKGYLGPFIGKLGTAVGTYMRGKNFLKSLPIASKKSSESQQEQRAIFKMVSGFLEPMTGLLSKSFTTKADGSSGYNEALKQVIEEAVSGTPPVINFNLVQVSKGRLRNAKSPTVTVAPGTLTFNWTNNTDGKRSFADDKAILVAYCESVKFSEYTLTGAARNAGTAVLQLPDDFTGQVVQTWISFVSADGKKSADSKYLGAITAL